MKKHPKQAFGIFHDGLAVRMVQLTREGKEVFLQSVDHTELDRYWYKILDEPSLSAVDAKTKEERSPAKNDIQIDEFDPDYVTNYQLQPSERMLASFDLRHGVIALNVYDDNILKDNFGAVSKAEISQFVKSKVPSKQLRTGDWQSAIVSIGGQKQHWLHSGTNRLFDLLHDYQRANKLPLFYQLADANDIALTDYFKVAYQNNLEKPTLLVYMGQEYRKAFVFIDGVWTDTLKLQISQTTPDFDIISSKLALAIDSAGLKEPEVIVMCGDLVSFDLIEHMRQQFPSEQVEMLSYYNLSIASQDNENLEMRNLTQFAIPIALAYKALFPEDSRFTPSNFLPSRIVEGQKELKVAWHGFIVLFFIFAVTLVATNLILKTNLTVKQEKALKRDLDFQLEQRRKEAAEIQKIRNELEQQERNIDILKGILDNKNPWTEVLNIANRVFANQGLSWLTNLKLDNNELFLAGVTTKRSGIIAFANAFPDSKIRRVLNSKVRNNNVWTFEITSALPKVDWIGEIEKDMEELVRLKQQFGEEQQQKDKLEAEKKQANGKVKFIAPQKVANAIQIDKKGRVTLPLLDQSICPEPREEITQGEGDDVQDYFKFVTAVNRGNIWEYRDLGQRYITRYRKSELVPAVRWWMSYRLYLDREYDLANQFLEPMLSVSDRYLPYVLLLRARIDYANGNERYKTYYGLLKNDYGRHVVMSQVYTDLDLIAKGVGK
jgi:Tfp pilus assembly protein PilN